MMKIFKSMMLVAVAAMGFAACTPDKDTNVTAKNETKTIKIVGDITRTEFNDARTQLVWSEGDTIGVFTDEGDINAKSSAYPKEFTVTVNKAATEVYAYYPYYDGNKDKTSNKMSVGIKGTIEQSKPGKITTLGAVPLIGVGTIVDDTVSITFESYACVLALNVYGGESTTEKVESIKFTGDKKSSGFDYNFNIENCDASTYTPAYDYTLVKLTGDAQFTPNGTKPAVASEFANAVFMPVAKQTYGAGSVFEVTTSEKTYTFTATSAINCDQGYATLNLNLAKADKPNVDEGDNGDNDEVIDSSGNPYASDAPFVCSTDNSTNAYTLGATKIDNQEATGFKLGSSKKAGLFTSTAIGVSGTKTLNFYAVAWNNTEATLYIKVDNGDVMSFALKANSGASGSIPFSSLSLSESDHYSVVLNNLTATSKISFSTNKNFTNADDSKTGRAVVCGIKLADGEIVNEIPVIKISNDNINLTAQGAEGTVEVTSKYLKEDITVSYDDVEWFAADLNDDGNLYYIAEANESDEERSITVTLKSGTASDSIVFTQAKKIISIDGETTVKLTISTLGSTNGTGYTSLDIDENIMVTFDKASSTTAPAYYDGAIRLYQNGAKMVVKAKNGKTINSIVLTFSGKHNFIKSDIDTWDSASGTWTGEATEVPFTTTGTDKNSRAYITSIQVTYK